MIPVTIVYLLCGMSAVLGVGFGAWWVNRECEKIFKLYQERLDVATRLYEIAVREDTPHAP